MIKMDKEKDLVVKINITTIKTIYRKKREV